MNSYLLVQIGWGTLYQTEETFCEYLIKWKNNEKSQGTHSFKQEVMESRRERLCWWLDLAWHKEFHHGTSAMQWSGGEISGGEQTWTSPSIRIQRILYVPRESCMHRLVSHVSCVIHGLKL